jgi:hypothetical protein
MHHRNIIIFGDPAIDTRFVVELAGASISPFDPFRSVFETISYDVTIDDQQYCLHHIAGIPSSRTLLLPNVLEELHPLINLLLEVHLLIYVVRTDKPTSNNFRFFYDYLCQQDAPIILVQTTQSPSEVSWFDLVLTLDGAHLESDKVNLQKAITKHLNRKPKFMLRVERFELAARGCWKLLRKAANWSLADFRDALKVNHKKYGRYHQSLRDSRCEDIIEDFQMSLNKQSDKNEIQRRVDAILSTIIAVGNVTPIPFLSVAAENIENIGETVQVCATTIDLRSSLIAYNQTIETNQEALESLANDAKRLVVLLWGVYHKSHDRKNWPSEELRDILEALVRYVQVSQ